MKTKTKCLILVSIFMVLEFLPFPVLAFVLLYVVLNRPAWFRDMVNKLYQED